ncbi:hypothetical protein E2C01_058972 [Portunus trituberculatus]|uniref:Uncharacterized protein n=1 Tax=Portunus trituberculatus TaxID=210409 RepID=A0A5B7GXT5_PORTR|nr:hypothetical protein [Portunus trituberculatus]
MVRNNLLSRKIPHKTNQRRRDREQTDSRQKQQQTRHSVLALTGDPLAVRPKEAPSDPTLRFFMSSLITGDGHGKAGESVGLSGRAAPYSTAIQKPLRRV